MTDYFDTGFSVREPMWHGGGRVLDQHPENWGQARTAAGLEWDPIEAPTYEFLGVDAAGRPVRSPIAAVAGDYRPDPDRKRIVRSDTGATLAVVNNTYTPIGHAEMGEVVDAVLAQPNVRYETAGAIEGGKGVWALALLDEPVTLTGAIATDDTITLPYVALLNRHDGGSSFSLTATAVRVVCANTWKAAEVEGRRNGTTYSFRHTRNWRNRVDEAKEAITGARKAFDTYCQIATELLSVPITPRQRELFVREFIPTPPDGIVSDRVVQNVETARAHIRAVLESTTAQPVAHTAYGLVQAAGEYLDHIQTARSWETRLNRSLLTPNNGKARAVKIARHVATTDV